MSTSSQNHDHASQSGQSAAGSAPLTEAQQAEVLEKARKMIQPDDWVVGLALSKAQPGKEVEVVKIFTDLLESKATLNTEGYQCEICEGWVPPGAHTCPSCGTW